MKVIQISSEERDQNQWQTIIQPEVPQQVSPLEESQNQPQQYSQNVQEIEESTKRSSRYLKSLLGIDERIVYYRKVRSHELCGTNRRLIYLKSTTGTKEFDDVPYDNIAGISFTTATSWATVSLGILLFVIGFLGIIIISSLIFLFLVLIIAGIICILFSQYRTLKIKMIGGNIDIIFPRATAANIVKEASKFIDSMRVK